MKRIAINGMGRIGRLVLRNYIERKPKGLELVAVNARPEPKDLAYITKYDSVQGRAPFTVEYGEKQLILDGVKVPLVYDRDPSKLPWKDLGVDIVLECTGAFKKKADNMAHVAAGAKMVIVSAPVEDADITAVMGVNEDAYDPAKHTVVSNASCTTNSLAPVTKVLNDEFGIEYLMGTTIHAVTGSQFLVDSTQGKGRKGRSAMDSIIPTSTGAAKAMVPLFPELKGRMDMGAVRVPVADGSLTDIVVHLKKDVTVESVNGVLKAAAEGRLKGILEYCTDEIISVDIIGNPHSGIVDAPSTKVLQGRVAKVMVWYDNEYGYANRMIDLALHVAGR
jgi:glyceraldehyde 3-phosphate dehydrogenase/glyceraldehyde-3-phosphate dehydrogenase (NAD(P))